MEKHHESTEPEQFTVQPFTYYFFRKVV